MALAYCSFRIHILYYYRTFSTGLAPLAFRKHFNSIANKMVALQWKMMSILHTCNFTPESFPLCTPIPIPSQRKHRSNRKPVNATMPNTLPRFVQALLARTRQGCLVHISLGIRTCCFCAGMSVLRYMTWWLMGELNLCGFGKE
jgi:hypothetical protein